jgi:hypothetical protein
MNSDSETTLARRSFSESEGQGWCSDESGLDDPRPLEPHMRVVNRDQGWGFFTAPSCSMAAWPCWDLQLG